MNARLILTTSTLLLAATSHAAEWEKLPPLPEAVSGSVVGTDMRRIYLIGGTRWYGGTQHWSRAAWAYTPATKSWEPLDDLREPVAYAVADTRLSPISRPASLHFVGGSNGSNVRKFFSTVEERAVVSKGVVLPAHAVLSSGGIIGKKMILTGGTHDPMMLSHLSKNTWSMDLDTGDVRMLTSHPGPAFGMAASATAAGRLFVFGGASWDAARESVVNLDSAHAFRLSKNEWQKLRPLPYAVRGMNAAVVHYLKPKDGASMRPFIYLAGGCKGDTDGFTDEAFLYDIEKDEYLPAPPLPYKAIVALVVHDEFVYCLGGEDKKQSPTDAFYRIKMEELLPE